MPRYFVNINESKSESAFPDADGVFLRDAEEAKQEALGLARDISRHTPARLTRNLKVVVVDENRHEILSISPSEVSARGRWSSFNLASRFNSHLFRVPSRIRIWLITAMVTNILQVAVVTWLIAEQPGTYELASSAPEGAVVAVRFVANTSISDIYMFLHHYNASIVDGPGPGEIFRLRVSDDALPKEELAKIVRHMAQEKVVDVAATVN